jgi:predicted nucleic acid-binding Zn ribbon protein
MAGDNNIKDGINKDVIFEMRRSGAPMREIADKIGRSKERVRQILMSKKGSTRHEYLSTLQLCNASGLPRNRIVALYQKGVINPVTKWNTGNRDYLLWSHITMKQIIDYFETHRLCNVCKKPLPKNRTLFCSDKCRQERHKYKYLTPEEKRKVLENIKRYRERRKLLLGRI